MVCELCGSNEFTKDNDGLFVCDYCRTKYTAEQAKNLMVEGVVKIDRSDDTANLIELAKAALSNKNFTEAIEFANRALEIDPKNPEAWFVKGASSGWVSSLIDNRLGEMVGAFKSAIANSTESETVNMRLNCAEQTTKVVLGVNHNSRVYLGQKAQIDGVWEQHIARADTFFGILAEAFEWSGNREPLDGIVTVYSGLIYGARYTLPNGTPNVRKLSAAGKAKYQIIFDDAVSKLKNLDSSYVAPEPKQVGLCFVITATMGSETAHPVIILRKFRDEILMRTNIGLKFNSWYYENGPRVAEIIRVSPILRVLSFVIVVCPATAFASAALGIKKLLDK